MSMRSARVGRELPWSLSYLGMDWDCVAMRGRLSGGGPEIEW
jgi:hypothetical protein